MLKKINILFLAIVLIASTSSCSDDFLETKPTDAISSGDALATADNMALIINGIHRLLYAQGQVLLSGGTSWRAGNHYWIPLGDNLAGGIIHTASANNLGWQDEARWISHNLETSRTSEHLWYQRYHIIAETNAIINQAATGNIVEDSRFKEILGQAHAYRAYAYLSLVQHYAKGYLIGNPASDPGVPLLFSTEAPFTSAPRSTVQEIYDQCMSDVNTAIGYFQDATDRGNDKSQLNINTAYGLKARIALNSGNWSEASTAAKAARNGYPLMGESDYYSGFNSLDVDEVIWGSYVISTETTFFRSYFYLISNTFNGSQVRNNPKAIDKRLYAQIPDTDYRQGLFLKDAPNSNSSAANGEGGWDNNTNPIYTTEDEFEAEIDRLASVYGWTSRHNTHPYMHVKFKQKIPGGIEPDDIIYMRSSEMYLIEAEAEAMMSNISNAQNALQALGGARDSAYDATAFATADDLMDEIKFQRALELWGEGFGYTDKIRWDEGFDHGADGGSGASPDLFVAGFSQEKPSINNDWIFKIPQKEIDANPNLGPGDQN